MALLAQDPLLFPHLSVLDNVAFGPKSAGQSTAQARSTARGWLEKVEAIELAARKPVQLSGGQAQRVAIARALATDPTAAAARRTVGRPGRRRRPLLRRVLRQVLADRSAIIVTHDLLDALLLSHRVLVIDGGRIVESGRTDDVIRHPRTPFTARIAGLNMIAGHSDADGVRHSDGQLIQGVSQAAPRAGEPAIAVFSPTAVVIFTDEPHSSARNILAVTITELEPRDEQVRVRAATVDGISFSADVTAQTITDLDLYPGRSVYYAIKATAVTIYPA